MHSHVHLQASMRNEGVAHPPPRFELRVDAGITGVGVPEARSDAASGHGQITNPAVAVVCPRL